MDFAMPYTEGQERFRQVVRAWLEGNIPEEMKVPIDPRVETEEQHRFWRKKHVELARIGWLYPTYPKEYGGGGLTGDHETVLAEELRRANAWVLPPNLHVVLSPLLVWATEEQKQKFLVPMLKGEVSSCQKLTEPHSGADLADVHGVAVRDGDDWLVTGQNVFISCWGDEDYYPGVMMTDPEAPRHRNLGYFMVPNNTPGLEIRAMNLLTSSTRFPGPGQKAIFMENVRVPSDHLIGGDHQGWQVMQTLLEAEHGGRGRAIPREQVVHNLVSYLRKSKQNGGALGSDPVVQQTVMEAVIDAHRDDLLDRRTYWMYQSRMEIKHEGNVANLNNRLQQLRSAIRVRDVMGMYSLLDAKEPGAPHGGAQEVNQRDKAGQRHAGGSTNIAKVILARRIGVSRTRERAAPTPSSASSHGS